MITKTLRYLTLALAFAGLSANAYAGYNGESCGTSNDNDCCDERFSASIHGIIAKPFQDVQWLQNTETTAPNNMTHNYLDYDWDWGVAATFGYKFCDDWGVGVRYSYIQADADDSLDVSTANLTAGDVLTFGNGSSAPTVIVAAAGLVSAKLETELHTLDIIAQYDCCLCGNFKFQPFGGVRILSMENDYSVRATTGLTNTYTTAGDGVAHAQELTAYGAVGGFDWEWNVCNDFYLIGSVTGSAMASDEESTYSHTLITVVTTSKEDPDCRTLLSFDANVGVAWNTCLWGRSLDVQALYESRYLSHVDVGTPNLSRDTGYGVHGFKLGVGLSF